MYISFHGVVEKTWEIRLSDGFSRWDEAKTGKETKVSGGMLC